MGAAFHAGGDCSRSFNERGSDGMFASVLNPCVQLILIEIEEFAALIARNGVIRSFDAALETRK